MTRISPPCPWVCRIPCPGWSLTLREAVIVQLAENQYNNRYKLKFSPDKVDTMIVQAIALLDDLDKEINIYAMRVKVRLAVAASSPSSPS